MNGTHDPGRLAAFSKETFIANHIWLPVDYANSESTHTLNTATEVIGDVNMSQQGKLLFNDQPSCLVVQRLQKLFAF